VQNIFNELYISKSYVDWGKYSKDRFKFDVIVRNCKEGIPKYIEIIIEVIGACIQPEKEPELKFDMLNLLDFIIEFKEISDTITENGLAIITKIINPVTVWRVGKPNIKIRKAGALIMMKLLDNNLVLPKDLLQGSCASSNLSNKIGYKSNTCSMFSIPLTEKSNFSAIETDANLRSGAQSSDMQFFKLGMSPLYPCSKSFGITRLLRIAMCGCLKVFLQTCQNVLTSSTWDYIMKACLVH